MRALTIELNHDMSGYGTLETCRMTLTGSERRAVKVTRLTLGMASDFFVSVGRPDRYPVGLKTARILRL
jgi:hypothetical protein